MERAESTNAAKVGQQAGYGLNNYSSPHKNWVYREHNGGVNGGLTELSYLPAAKLGHVIMVNSGDYATFSSISKLVRDYETQNLTPPKITNDIEISEAHKTIEGLYYPINSRQQMSYFIDRIFNVEKLWFDGNKLVRKGLLSGEPTNYSSVSAELYKSDKTGLISLSVAEDPLVGTVVHANNRVLKPTNALSVYGQLIISIVWLLAIISSVLYMFVWGIRKLDKKILNGATIRIRLWPLLSALSIITLVIFFAQGGSSPFESFGAPSLISLGIFISTIFFALFSILGFYTAIKERNTKMNRVNYWYCTLSSSTHFLVTLYFLWFGVIGLMTWA